MECKKCKAQLEKGVTVCPECGTDNTPEAPKGIVLTPGKLVAVIAAVVLLAFGTGSVQGFATTLLIGVITSMISAILVTRFLLTRFVRVFPETKLYAAVKEAK